MVVTLTYHGQVIAKKNNWKPRQNLRTGGLMIVPTTTAKIQEQALVGAFSAGFPLIDKKEVAGKSCSVSVSVWNRDRRRHDLDNQVSTILDALVKAGALPDDNQLVVRRITATYAGVDKNDPRAIITIQIKEEDETTQ